MFESLSAWLIQEVVVVIVVIQCKLKQPASKQAEQLGGFGDRGNMLIVKESNKIINK